MFNINFYTDFLTISGSFTQYSDSDSKGIRFVMLLFLWNFINFFAFVGRAASRRFWGMPFSES